MITRKLFSQFLLSLYLCIGVCLSAVAQVPDSVKLSYVALADDGDGLLYEPITPGLNAHVGLINIHSASSYLNHSSCMNMAERGYRILCGNTRFTNNEEGYIGFEDHAPAINSAVEYMRNVPSVTKVVLIGHSMGSPMMAFYQNIAENGPNVCQGSEKIIPCEESNLHNLSSADGLILLDPHYGSAVGTLTYMDPAITDESKPGQRDLGLDMFSEENGYTPDGANYSAKFQKKFLVAQANRHKRITELALEQWKDLKSDGGKTLYKEDMPFIVLGDQSRLWQPDLSLLSKSKKPHLLLKADESQSNEILMSVRQPSVRTAIALSNESTLEISLRRWLGNHAIRTTPEYGLTAEELIGVDWDSSATSTPGNISTITVPLLVMVMTGHYFLHSGELLIERSGSTEKELVGVEGASHGIRPCEQCGETPGQFGDTVKRTYDYIDSWLANRY